MRSIQVENRKSYGNSSISSLVGYALQNERRTINGILQNGTYATKCSDKNILNHFNGLSKLGRPNGLNVRTIAKTLSWTTFSVLISLDSFCYLFACPLTHFYTLYHSVLQPLKSIPLNRGIFSSDDVTHLVIVPMSGTHS